MTAIKHRKSAHLCILFAIALLPGCAAPRMNTASGRPEVTVSADKPKMKSALINEFVNQHFIVITDSDAALIMDGDANGWLTFWFTNTLTGERPRVRIRFTFAAVDGKTRVIAAAGMTSAPGINGRQSEEEFSNRRVYEDLQYKLDCVAADLEGRNRPAEPVYKTEAAAAPRQR